MKKSLHLLLLLLIVHVLALKAAPALHPDANKFSRPADNDSTLVLIPFDYKQSALYHPYTLEVIDSVIKMLLVNKKVTLSITGYAHPDEGSDTICKYLSLNRAIFVRNYIHGRGVDSARIILVKGMGKLRSLNSDINKDGHKVNCKVELRLNFPPPPAPIVIPDRDGDGIPDAEDKCPDEFGYLENKGCPDKDVSVIPFEMQQAALNHFTYLALDSILAVLWDNPSAKVVIQGHAYKQEGSVGFCERLAQERGEMVRSYFLSRNIGAARILSVTGFGSSRPINAGRNPQQVAQNARAEVFILK